MITCKELITFLDRYLSDELSTTERTVFSDHLRDCPCCVNYMEKYRATVRLERCCCGDDNELPADVPESLVQAILKARAAAK